MGLSILEFWRVFVLVYGFHVIIMCGFCSWIVQILSFFIFPRETKADSEDQALRTLTAPNKQKQESWKADLQLKTKQSNKNMVPLAGCVIFTKA